MIRHIFRGFVLVRGSLEVENDVLELDVSNKIRLKTLINVISEYRVLFPDIS